MGSGLVDEAKGLIYELIVRGVGVGVGWGGGVDRACACFVCLCVCLSNSFEKGEFILIVDLSPKPFVIIFSLPLPLCSPACLSPSSTFLPFLLNLPSPFSSLHCIFPLFLLPSSFSSLHCISLSLSLLPHLLRSSFRLPSLSPLLPFPSDSVFPARTPSGPLGSEKQHSLHFSDFVKWI